MGFFSKIKEAIVGNSAKQNEKYVVGLDKSSETFSDRINELAARFLSGMCLDKRRMRYIREVIRLGVYLKKCLLFYS